MSASELVIDGLAALQQKLVEKTTQKAQRAADREAAKEADRVAKYPAYVSGSCRDPNAEDLEAVGQCHGKVATIRCQDCGEQRTVNTQELFQCTLCKSCKAKADRDSMAAKRAAKKVSGLSQQEIERRISELTSLLATKAA
jgi:NAD-dependent SIR2 family protein deacetylase